MKNRGPDFQDYKYIKTRNMNIYLLHSRLSIIDLDERSHQPFSVDHRTLVFNGEIYNYLELRKELEKKGISFRTASDTEVLLRSYLLYGENCVDYFEGMWSFAIYDRQENKLFLSRDRFAEKPLYYFHTNSGIYFGSEIKFIKCLAGTKLTIDKNHLLRYMIDGYKSLYKTGETFYQEIKEVPYAANLVMDNQLNITQRKYWHPRYAPQSMTLEEAV
ncbi:MAG: asparagine synthase (glutamine-hydrolyzing), partial [bacterium]|nr:asparagine synthase (glutamine-hydrolyzing) [bacterium]